LLFLTVEQFQQLSLQKMAPEWCKAVLKHQVGLIFKWRLTQKRGCLKNYFVKGVNMPLQTVLAAARYFNEKSVDGVMEFIDCECLIFRDQKMVPITGGENLRNYFKKGFEANPYSELILEDSLTAGTVLMTREINIKNGCKGDAKSLVSMWVYQVADHKIKVMHEFTLDYKATQ